ncbi:MAG TPA: zinc ribbon domain-containing protein [Candidatus Sulfotelmatobacter sp.]
MFCDSCGTNLHPGQAFCSGCGKPIIGPVPALVLSLQSRQRVQRNLQLLAILWFAISAFNVLIGVATYIIANTLFARPGGTMFLRPLLSAVSIFVLGGSALGFFAGWGLMNRDAWARPLTLVLAFFVLFINIPLGTAVGVYTLWVLLPRESQQEYEALALPNAA